MSTQQVVGTKNEAVLMRWNDIESEQLTPLVHRQYLSTPPVTLARFQLKKGAFVPTHQHVNEQVSYVVSGALKFVFPDKELTVRAGEVLCIPSELPHSAEAVEDCYAIDIFTPARQDWAAKTDSYFMK